MIKINATIQKKIKPIIISSRKTVNQSWLIPSKYACNKNTLNMLKYLYIFNFKKFR